MHSVAGRILLGCHTLPYGVGHLAQPTRLYSKHGLGWGRVTYTHEGASWLGVAMAIDMCSYHQVSKHAKQMMYHMIFHVVMFTTHITYQSCQKEVLTK